MAGVGRIRKEIVNHSAVSSDAKITGNRVTRWESSWRERIPAAPVMKRPSVMAKIPWISPTDRFTHSSRHWSITETPTPSHRIFTDSDKTAGICDCSHPPANRIDPISVNSLTSSPSRGRETIS